MKLALGLDVQTNAKGGKFMSIEDSRQGALVCKADVEVLWEPFSLSSLTPSAHFRHGHKDALGYLSAGPDEAQPRPHPHALRAVLYCSLATPIGCLTTTQIYVDDFQL